MEECRGGPFPRTRSHPASCETPAHHYNPRWASRYRDRDFTGPISKKILSAGFSEWATIHPEQRSGTSATKAFLVNLSYNMKRSVPLRHHMSKGGPEFAIIL
jgi:hypothetical protein